MTIPDPARYDLEARITAASEDIDRWHSGGAPTAEGQAYGVMRADALALLDYCQRYELMLSRIVDVFERNDPERDDIDERGYLSAADVIDELGQILAVPGWTGAP